LAVVKAIMEKTRLSSKGQVVIPKSVRDAHHWRAGQEFIVIDLGDGVLLKERQPFEETELDDVAGSLGFTGPPKTLEEMEEAIKKGVNARQHDSR
jgi:AbrB family looped-hinge helix DNA binding protein